MTESSELLYLTHRQIRNSDYSPVKRNQLVGAGTMAPAIERALTATEIGRVTGGTVDKTPTDNRGTVGG